MAKDRYVRGQQEQFIPCNMSDYFLRYWADGNKKPFVNNNGERIHMDSLVAKQPPSFQINQEQAIFNYRKLTGLPHHLLCSAQLDELKRETLCNFEFLLAKLKATSINVVLDDFTDARNVWGDDDDIRIVEKFLMLSSMALRKHPRQFA